jgi:hypothetical protein
MNLPQPDSGPDSNINSPYWGGLLMVLLDGYTVLVHMYSPRYCTIKFIFGFKVILHIQKFKKYSTCPACISFES